MHSEGIATERTDGSTAEQPHGARRPWWLVLALVLLAAIWFAYAPSRKHLPHSDHWAFLLDTIGRNDFRDLVSHTYSYNRTRLVRPGDTQLFRPMFFVWLSGLKALFDTHFEHCQTIGIVLHGIVCFLFLLLLRRVRAGGPEPNGASRWSIPFAWLPFALVFFYAMNYTVIEQVIWFNIQPYLLAIALLLGSVLLLWRATEEGRTYWRLHLAGAWLLGLTAAFTYELGQFYAVCAAGFLAFAPWASGRRRAWSGVAFLGIVILYQSVNQFDRWHHQRSYWDDVALVELVDSALDMTTFEHAARYALYTVIQPFLPCHVTVHSHGKLWIGEQVWAGEMPLRLDTILDGSIFLLWLGLAVVGAVGLWRQRDRKTLMFAGMLGGVAAAHAALSVLGRMNIRPGPEALGYNSHYTYITLLWVLATSAVCLTGLRGLGGSRNIPVRSAVGVLCLGLLGLGIGSAFKVHRLNTRLAKQFRPSRAWLHSLSRFVEKHQNDPNFRFAFVAGHPHQIHDCTFVPMPFVFFQRYADRKAATHAVWFQAPAFRWAPIEEWRAAHRHAPPHFHADFVHMGRDYQVFEREGWYYSIHWANITPFLYTPRPWEEDAFHPKRSLAEALRWIDAHTFQ